MNEDLLGQAHCSIQPNPVKDKWQAVLFVRMGIPLGILNLFGEFYLLGEGAKKLGMMFCGISLLTIVFGMVSTALSLSNGFKNLIAPAILVMLLGLSGAVLSVTMVKKSATLVPSPESSSAHDAQESQAPSGIMRPQRHVFTPVRDITQRFAPTKEPMPEELLTGYYNGRVQEIGVDTVFGDWYMIIDGAICFFGKQSDHNLQTHKNSDVYFSGGYGGGTYYKFGRGIKAKLNEREVSEGGWDYMPVFGGCKIQ